MQNSNRFAGLMGKWALHTTQRFYFPKIYDWMTSKITVLQITPLTLLFTRIQEHFHLKYITSPKKHYKNRNFPRGKQLSYMDRCKSNTVNNNIILPNNHKKENNSPDPQRQWHTSIYGAIRISQSCVQLHHTLVYI